MLFLLFSRKRNNIKNQIKSKFKREALYKQKQFKNNKNFILLIIILKKKNLFYTYIVIL